MHELTLEWIESGQRQTYTIGDRLLSAHHQAVRIGRDPSRCDWVLQHPSISGLHVEIFFAESKRCFCLRNLRESNPPVVDGQMVQGEATLRGGSTISLGQMTLRVVSVISEKLPIPPTLLFAPNALEERVLPQPLPAPVAATYGLRCSRCQQISPYQQLETGCRWCGASLAAAASVLMVPDPLQS